MKYLLLTLLLIGCDTDKDYCLKTVKYQKANGDFVLTTNTKVDCDTCEPLTPREGFTFIECVD
jgi:hypothetical protein